MAKEKEKCLEIVQSSHTIALEKVKKALLKRATGYTAVDEVEEYVFTAEGDKRLAKQKKTYYEVAPDMTAIKILLDTDKESVVELTEAQLLKERERLFILWAQLQEEKNLLHNTDVLDKRNV